jgi:membrane-associated phospholipid phosphatase
MYFRNLDISIFYYINHWPHPVIINHLAILVHYATRGGLIYLPLLLLLLNKNFRKLFWLLLISIISTTFFVDLILKPLINRPRPFDVLTNVITILPLPQNASFPSSQTAVAATVITACVLLLPGKWKYPLWLWLIIVGLDRIYMGHHYPSDVIAGFALGTGISTITYLIQNKYKKSLTI